MASFITLHLFSRPDQELIINPEHIVSIEGANEGSANVQLVAGQHRVAESVEDVIALIAGTTYSRASDAPSAPLAAPETKSKKKTEAPAE